MFSDKIKEYKIKIIQKQDAFIDVKFEPFSSKRPSY